MGEIFYEGLLKEVPSAQALKAMAKSMGPQKYYLSNQQYSQSGPIQSNCNAILFVNDGTSNAIVLGRVIAPGIALSISGNEGELDVTQYSVLFQGAGENILSVLRKVYT